jgi:glutamate racemase
MQIGIYDSGIGGLSVLREALKRLPDAHYRYYADTDNVPYGNKPKPAVRGYAFEAVGFLHSRGCQALVVACNTATSVAIDDLRASFPLPIIGMEPAVKPAVLAHNHKRVLVLATEMTLKEPKFHNLVARIDGEGIVDYLSMQKLVTFAERFAFEPAAILAYLESRLDGLDRAAYGTVVLGCTHFLYFRPLIRQLFPAGTQIIDGNAGTIQRLLTQVETFPDQPAETGLEFFHSGRPADPEGFQRYLALLDQAEGEPV